MPSVVLILNRNPDFNKGINKVLKMIAMMPGPIDQVTSFIMQRFHVGTLTAQNLLSFLRFLSKVASEETPVANAALDML